MVRTSVVDEAELRTGSGRHPVVIVRTASVFAWTFNRPTTKEPIPMVTRSVGIGVGRGIPS
jgi:hypothetical protein